MDISLDVGGTVTHAVSNSGKITIGSVTKGGEVYFTFDPADYESQMIRAENAMRLLNYAKHLYDDPSRLPNLTPKEPVALKAQGAVAKVG